MRLQIGSGRVMVEEKHGELNFSYAILGMAESNRIQTDAYRTGTMILPGPLKRTTESLNARTRLAFLLL